MKTANLVLTFSFGVSRIINVKKMVEVKSGVPIDHLRLIFVGKELEDNFTVDHYNIIKSSTLHVVTR